MRDESKEKQNGGNSGADEKSASQLVTAICTSLEQAMTQLVAAHKQSAALNQSK